MCLICTVKISFTGLGNALSEICCAFSGTIRMLFKMGEPAVGMISTSKKFDEIKIQFSALPISENDFPIFIDRFGLELATP